MTEALFLEIAEKEQRLRKQGKHRLNIFGVLKKIGVSTYDNQYMHY